MGIIFVVLFGLAGLLVLGGAVYLIYSLVKNKDQKLSLPIDTLLKIYLYIISFATLAGTVIGAVIFLNSVFSYRISIPFSFSVRAVNEKFPQDEKLDSVYTYTDDYKECYQGKAMVIENQKVCFDSNSQKEGIVTGLSFMISMAILFTIHTIGIYFSEKKQRVVWLKKLYNFVSLIAYSVVGAVSIPFATYLILNYVYFRQEDITRVSSPGPILSIAILTLPVWIYFLVATLGLKEDKKK